MTINKENLLEDIESAAREGVVTHKEVVNAYIQGSQKVSGSKPTSLANILYYIGGAIVFIGLIVLVSQQWETLSSFARIFASLGSAIALFSAAMILESKKKFRGVSNAFHLIAAPLMAVGMFITLYEFDVDIQSLHTQVFIVALIAAMYAAAYFTTKRIIILIFFILYTSALFFGVTDLVVQPVLYSLDEINYIFYRIMTVGVTYMLLGYAFQKGNRKALTGWLYAAGSALFLLSALVLGKWEPDQVLFWELIYPGLVFGILFLSVYVRSLGFLIFGALFLVIYIAKITAEYFADSIGWPLVLVIVGFALIGSGYLLMRLYQRYIKD